MTRMTNDKMRRRATIEFAEARATLRRELRIWRVKLRRFVPVSALQAKILATGNAGSVKDRIAKDD